MTKKVANFQAPSIIASEAEGEEFAYEGIGAVNDDGFDKGTIEDSVLGHLKRSSSMRSEQFAATAMESNRRSSMASNAGRNYSIRKGVGEAERNQSYPGVIIEEMLDSASMHNGDYPVALIEDQPGGSRQPEVSI